MSATRMTSAMRRSLEHRLEELAARIAALEEHDAGDDRDGNDDATALRLQLTRERSHALDVLRDATLIDDEPFDTHAIEVGDFVTIQGEDGDVDRYVLVDEGVGTRARADWVSVGSPLGAALLGRGKGDVIEVESPGGTSSYLVVDFERASEEDSRDVSAATLPGSTPTSLPSEVFVG